MENRFTLRISRMFRSSFGSCRTRKISDVIEKPVFTPETHNTLKLFNPSPSPSPPKARPFPSICKPKRHKPIRNAINHDCVMITPRETIPRRKVLARYPPFVVSCSGSGSDLGFDGRKFPAGNNPLSPLNLFSDCKDFGFYEKKKSIARHKTKKKKKKKKKKMVHLKSKNTSNGATFFSSSSQESANHYYSNHRHSGWWWLSSEEDETETLFSSRNLSSDSSEPFTGRHHHSRRSDRKRCINASRRRPKNRSCNMGVLPLEGADNNKVRDSFAVVKRSSDPYNDFRTSMVEMIVERQMFGAEDLEQLLQCFLSLNSRHHHRIIIEVFTEIWETLFSNCSYNM